MTPLFCLAGALFRRFWGGWFSPAGWLKRVLGYLLPIGILFFHLGAEHWLFNLLASALVLFAWLMPHHGYGITMGEGERPLWKCAMVMGLQYGSVTAAIGVMGHFMLGHGLVCIPFGFAVPFFYWLGYRIIPNNTKFLEWPKGNWFIDGGTCVGELGLGALIMGGLCVI